MVARAKAMELLKGCKVHWQHSCQRVADRVATSSNRKREKDIFLAIASQVQKLESAVDIVSCFEALCGVRPIKELIRKIPTVCSFEDAKFIDKQCDWTIAKHWAQWWTRSSHLKMLSKAFSPMDKETLSKCPSTTNAVERKNKDCTSENPQGIKLDMSEVYKIDKVACLKHIAAQHKTSLSYRSRTEEAATKKQKQRYKNISTDKSANFGPPDRPTNFSCGEPSALEKRARVPHISGSPTKKSKTIAMDRIVQFILNPRPDVLGKTVRMQFEEKMNGLKGSLQHMMDSKECLEFISPQMVKLILHPLMMKI